MHATDASRPGPIRCTVDRAWVIPAMVFGYIIWWPLGLALTFYMVFGDRWFREPFDKMRDWHDNHHAGRGTPFSHPGANRSSGNVAFDAYRADVMKRLEDERAEFEAFLARLRAAKDKSEFDTFMDDQAKRHNDAPASEGRIDDEGPIEAKPK